MSGSASSADPLWRFALAVYGAEGVAAECLALQQRHGADVCLLLAAAFAAAAGAQPDAAVLQAWDDGVRDWRDAVVRPIRGVRDALKPLQADPEVTLLRQAVLATELQAERHELRRLFAAYAEAALPPRPDIPAHKRIEHALAAACALYGADAVQLPRLLDAASAYGLGTSPDGAITS